jgi:ankyrin repeat protein
MTPTLLQAIESGDTEALRRLLLQGADIGFQDYTPLTYAVQCHQVGAVRLLLIAGSDPDARFGAPLISAAEIGNVEIAELLWKAGACLGIMDNAAFKMASKQHHTKFVDWLQSKMTHHHPSMFTAARA